VASLVFAGGFTACGTGSTAPSTATGTPTAALTTSASPSPEPTKFPLRPDAPEVTQVLALSGFPDFARQFAAAVDANDTQFFIDNAYFQTPDCPSPGEPFGTPAFCVGLGPPPSGLGIVMGAWNGEAGIVTQTSYESSIRDALSAEHAPNPYVYVFGHPKIGVEQSPTEVAVVVAWLPPASPDSPTPLEPAAMAFHVNVIDREWRILEVDRARLELVPEFFEWYAPWADVFPAS
jgi:hypothetical protein